MNRYQRQIQFIGEEGQKQLASKTALVVGLGALGSVAAELLARAGIGKLILVDRDIVELSNLQRQALYDETDVHKLKAIAAREKLKKINSSIQIESLAENFNEDFGAKADILLDCTDNLETRFLINSFARKNKMPWIYCGIAGSQGRVLVMKDDFCFNCVFSGTKEALTCDDSGVLGSTAHMAASIQVTEALKVLLNKEYCKDLIIFDVWKNSFEAIKVKKNENCAVCRNEKAREKESRNFRYEVRPCKTGAAYKTFPNKILKVNLDEVRKNFDVVLDTPLLVVVKVENEEVIVHGFGELVFKTLRNEDKVKEISEQIYNLLL